MRGKKEGAELIFAHGGTVRGLIRLLPSEGKKKEGVSSVSHGSAPSHGDHLRGGSKEKEECSLRPRRA